MGAALPLGQSLLRSQARFALLPAPTPRDVLSALGTPSTPIRGVDLTRGGRTCHTMSSRTLGRQRLPKAHHAGVGAGRSAQRGTSGATTGPRGRAALP